MTSAVEILVANLQDVLSVPVQALVQQKGSFDCWVDGPAGVERRPVELGLGNNTRIEIKSGLQVGDKVLLNPRASVADAQHEERDEEAIDVKQRFGGDKPKELPSPATAPAEAAGGGGRQGGSFNLMSLDKDGDKKISQDEAPERLKAVFSQLDGDGDGLLDAKEIGEATRKFRQMQQGGGRGGP
jgi:hypothetical protein